MQPSERIEKLRCALRRHLHGKNEAIEAVLVCLLAGGHVLIEDVPGVGKTTLAYTLARSVECKFNRIQFTSDILPSDILGVSIFQREEGRFEFMPGPVFAQIVLADEINRASPKSQSALLEVMERGFVSVDGESHEVDRPFMVIATQNPVDLESTFPLPQSQLDRFLMRLSLGYPDDESERGMLKAGNLHYDAMSHEAVIHPQEIEELQRAVDEVFVEETLLDYIHQLVKATRNNPRVEVGISPRGGLAFKRALQAAALVDGRDFVSPEDIKRFAEPCLTHRIRLAGSYSNSYDWQAAAEVIRNLLRNHPAPHSKD